MHAAVRTIIAIFLVVLAAFVVVYLLTGGHVVPVVKR